MKTIYICGDSHASMFQEIYRLPGSVPSIRKPKVVFADRSLGSKTAFALDTCDVKIQELLSSAPLQPGDEIWFVFGEIDVRFRIYYFHQELGITLDESIEIVADKYINYVKTLKYNVHIISIMPPQINPHPYYNDPDGVLPKIIKVGGNSVQDRIYITKKLNERLKIKCAEHNIPFCDIYPYLVDPKTECILPEMARDGMHYYYIGDLIIEKLNLENENDLHS